MNYDFHIFCGCWICLLHVQCICKSTMISFAMESFFLACSSNLPGRKRAASIAVIRLVVPTMRRSVVALLLLTPSISFKRVDKSLEWTSLDPSSSSSRFMAIASNSSMNRMHGAAALALVKIARMAASDPPSHWSRISDARTFGKRGQWLAMISYGGGTNKHSNMTWLQGICTYTDNVEPQWACLLLL